MPDGARAIAYLRVSVVGDRAQRGRLESPDLQRDAIDGWCERNNAIVVEEIRDLNRSAATLTRPGLERALQALRAGAADGIVVARSDRASRRTLDGLGLIDDLEREGFWLAAADGTIDTTDRIRRMATTMTLAMAQSELERFTEQSAIIHRRAIMEKGRHMGPAPFGYLRDQDGRLQIDAEHAAVVRQVFQRRADGAGWVALGRELERSGIRQRNGRLLNTTMLRRLVARRVYVGEASHGDHVRPASHPAVVDEALWAAANRARPAVGSSPRTGRVHAESVLRGLVRCQGCRYVLKRHPQRSGAVRWMCRTLVSERSATHDCSAPVVVRQSENVQLEAAVVDAFMVLAAGVGAERSEQTPDVAELQRRVSEAEGLLDELSSLETRRRLGAARWAQLADEARADVDAATRELASARAQSQATVPTDRATLEEAWGGMTVQERQQALGSIVQAVMVRAGGAPIAERVDVIPVWVAVDVPRRGSTGFVVRPWLGQD